MSYFRQIISSGVVFVKLRLSTSGNYLIKLEIDTSNSMDSYRIPDSLSISDDIIVTSPLI